MFKNVFYVLLINYVFLKIDIIQFVSQIDIFAKTAKGIQLFTGATDSTKDQLVVTYY